MQLPAHLSGNLHLFGPSVALVFCTAPTSTHVVLTRMAFLNPL
uniref:Uncharacterized protein n=1 Tax=Arundo donax TaxID=35708 RepID=A0A0A9ADE1_ARUDO